MSKTNPASSVKNLRMSNNIRDAFITAVMADVPKIDYEQRIRDTVAKLVSAATPVVVRKMLNDEAMEPWVSKLHVHINRSNCRMNDVEWPAMQSMSLVVNAPSLNWFYDLCREKLSAIGAEWQAADDARTRLERNLRAVVSNCQTTMKVAEAFPEFSKYLPQSEGDATRNLPAFGNVVDELKKAGWPAGKAP